jgi:hypothetical protein
MRVRIQKFVAGDALKRRPAPSRRRGADDRRDAAAKPAVGVPSVPSASSRVGASGTITGRFSSARA